jgi:energy-coupling factor transporter transmembrane protein EcfT
MRFSDQVKLYVMYLIPLFSIALRRAEEISNALFARGYTVTGRVRGGGRRADYIVSQYRTTPTDWAITAGLSAVFISAAVAQYGYGIFRLSHSPLNRYLQHMLGIA